MEIEDLARILKNAYLDGVDDKERKRNVALFAIRYAEDLEGISPAKLSCHTGPEVPEYAAEIYLGKQLSDCVGMTIAAIRILEAANR